MAQEIWSPTCDTAGQPKKTQIQRVQRFEMVKRMNQSIIIPYLFNGKELTSVPDNPLRPLSSQTRNDHDLVAVSDTPLVEDSARRVGHGSVEVGAVHHPRTLQLLCAGPLAGPCGQPDGQGDAWPGKIMEKGEGIFALQPFL